MVQLVDSGKRLAVASFHHSSPSCFLGGGQELLLVVLILLEGYRRSYNCLILGQVFDPKIPEYVGYFIHLVPFDGHNMQHNGSTMVGIWDRLSVKKSVP